MQPRQIEKLKALTHYICWKCKNPAMLGATKLNKTLWVADLRHYVRTGTSITGERYIKRQYGPVPATILDVVNDLVAEGAIVTRESAYGAFPKRDYIALKEPDISMFSPQEISLVDQAIEFVCRRHTAAEISRKTHDVIWELAEIGEEIPYMAMWATSLGEVTPEDVEWARSLDVAA